ncbi:MAG: hypothetical protein ACT4OM_00015 [Actinomycetota bacterium]
MALRLPRPNVKWLPSPGTPVRALFATTALALASACSPPSALPADNVLEFAAPRLGGGQVVGSELAGKDVAMFFWAPW